MEDITLLKMQLYNESPESSHHKSVKRKKCDNVWRQAITKRIRGTDSNEESNFDTSDDDSKHRSKKAKELPMSKKNNVEIDSIEIKHVFDAMGDEIDNVLEETAEKSKLTAANVKNILKGDKISLRTRSKLPLKDTSLEDISEDVYYTNCDDEDWQKFIRKYKALDSTGAIQKPDDPEYNVLVDGDIPDEFAFRCDNSVKVTRKALVADNLDSLQMVLNGADDDEEKESLKLKAMATELVKLDYSDVDDEEEESKGPSRITTPILHAGDGFVENVQTQWMIDEERCQLEEQMRMYVQLLTQSYLLSYGNPELSFINVSNKRFLEEIKMFASHSVTVNDRSAFDAHNLNQALEIVNYYESNRNKICLQHNRISMKHQPGLPNMQVKKTIYNSQVFMYPELLPSCGYHKCFETRKATFTPAEDNLIALGLEEFSFSRTPLYYINTLLVPPKTEYQINMRIKNLKAVEVAQDNPIKYYFHHGHAPSFPRNIRVFDANNVKAPKDLPHKLLPKWMRNCAALKTVLDSSPPSLPETPKTGVFRKKHSFNHTSISKPKYRLLLPRSNHLSPLKQISPILRKYNHKSHLNAVLPSSNTSRLRKTLAIKPALTTRKSVDMGEEMNGENGIESSVSSDDIGEAGKLNDGKTEQNACNVMYLVNSKIVNPAECITDICVNECDVPIKLEAVDEGDKEIIDDQPKSAQDSTVTNKINKKLSSVKKKNKQHRVLESSLSLLKPNLIENDPKVPQVKKDPLKTSGVQQPPVLSQEPVPSTSKLPCGVFEDTVFPTVPVCSSKKSLLFDFSQLKEIIGHTNDKDCSPNGNSKPSDNHADATNSTEQANQSPVSVTHQGAECNRITTPVLHVGDGFAENVQTQWMINEERCQLEEQMRMYVQLLTQSYLLSCWYPELNFINVSSKRFLEEIKMFASHSVTVNDRSAFNAHNLNQALEIVNYYESNRSKIRLQRTHASLKRQPGLPNMQVKKTIYNSQVFMYPELLPSCGYHKRFETRKATFTPAEDNLIALGLEEFSFSHTPLYYINTLLVPSKTKYQIKLRIKNSKAARVAQDNPIKYYFRHGRAPSFPRTIRAFNANNVKAPKDLPHELLPKWMRNFAAQKKVLYASPPILPILLKTAVSHKKRSFHRKAISNPRCRLLLPRSNHLSPLKQISLILKNQLNAVLPSSNTSKLTKTLLDSKINVTFFGSERLADLESSLALLEPNLLENDPKRNFAALKTVISGLPPVLPKLFLDGKVNIQMGKVLKPVQVFFQDVPSESAKISNNDSKVTTESMQPNCSLTTKQSVVAEQSFKSGVPQVKKDSVKTSVVPCYVVEDTVFPAVPVCTSKKSLFFDFNQLKEVVGHTNDKNCSPNGNFKLSDNHADATNSAEQANQSPVPVTHQEAGWNREEDKLIIYNCQRLGFNNKAFEATSSALIFRTPKEIQDRFLHLMDLLSKKFKL